MKLSTRQLLISFAAFAALALIFRLVLSPTASPASTAPSVIADIPVSSPTPVHFSAPTPPVTLATNKMSASAELVKKLIADNIVMVFSKSYCPYCKKAKRVLSEFPIKSLNIIELDERNDGDALQDVLGQMTGARSVPRVFIAGKCIGGGDDTERLQRDGKLKAMLEQAGAL